MTRYVVLVSFSESGMREVKDSVSRAEAFRAEATKLGAKVELLYWTMGAYDGVFVLNAPDEATAAAVVLNAGRGSAIRTTTLRAFDADEFFSRLVVLFACPLRFKRWGTPLQGNTL